MGVSTKPLQERLENICNRIKIKREFPRICCLQLKLLNSIKFLIVITDEKFHSKCKIIVYNSKCTIIETLQRIQLFFSFIHKCNNEFLVMKYILVSN